MTNPATKQKTSLRTGAELGPVRAILGALFWRSADFYPRVVSAGSISTLETVSVVKEMSAASARWPAIAADDDLAFAINLARQSLSEVKAQTEYQDQKATRLLTITTFLTALSGALFGHFEDTYPISALPTQNTLSFVLVGLGYVGFCAFIILSLSGALVTFHATRTRFKYPKDQTTEDQEDDPKSLLFYGGLIRSRPRAWMKGWVSGGSGFEAGDHAEIRQDLQQRYFQHLVQETYLVAAKTADKLRILEPAQSLLAASLRCLFAWLLVLALVGILVPSTKPVSKPLEVNLIQPSLPSNASPNGSLPATAPATGETGQGQ
jgi:hypothetical protein